MPPRVPLFDPLAAGRRGYPPARAYVSWEGRWCDLPAAISRDRPQRVRVTDTDAIANLDALRVLGSDLVELEIGYVVDISGLAYLTGLLKLEFRSEGDVSVLSGLTRLFWLDCGFVRDISPLRGLTGLMYLVFEGNIFALYD